MAFPFRSVVVLAGSRLLSCRGAGVAGVVGCCQGWLDLSIWL